MTPTNSERTYLIGTVIVLVAIFAAAALTLDGDKFTAVLTILTSCAFWFIVERPCSRDPDEHAAEQECNSAEEDEQRGQSRQKTPARGASPVLTGRLGQRPGDKPESQADRADSEEGGRVGENPNQVRYPADQHQHEHREALGT
jgi:hypothetical protein